MGVRVNVKLFVKDDCPRCPAAKRAVEGIDGVEVYNVGDIDGLAEASYYSILATPSILVLDAQGNEVQGWRGEVPESAHLRGLIAQ